MRPIPLLLLSIALIFVSGCAQNTSPSACSGVQQEKFANCIYVNAVNDQNPFYCYSLANRDWRATCMRDAAEPASRAAMQRLSPAQRDALFGAPDAANPEEKTPPPAPKPEEKPPAPTGCDAMTGTARDYCLRSSAFNNNTIGTCEAISDSAVRENCIALIAKKTRNITSCHTLADKKNFDLCNLYAKAE